MPICAINVLVTGYIHSCTTLKMTCHHFDESFITGCKVPFCCLFVLSMYWSLDTHVHVQHWKWHVTILMKVLSLAAQEVTILPCSQCMVMKISIKLWHFHFSECISSENEMICLTENKYHFCTSRASSDDLRMPFQRSLTSVLGESMRQTAWTRGIHAW